MHNDKLKPNPGESQMDWINRTRPVGAPEIQGQPTFDKDSGFVWLVGGWVVGVDADTVCTNVQWCTPDDGHACNAYGLNSVGEQWSDLPGEDGTTRCWPAIA